MEFKDNMKIILCRHGRTDFNNEKRYQGKIETHINEEGKKQAEAIADYLKDFEFDYVFSSPRKRCLETAEIILKNHEVDLKIKEELGEVNYGFFEGKSVEEINEKLNEHWEERINKKYDFVPEGGESYKEIDEKRVKPLLDEFKEKYYSRTILIVTHQGTGRLFLGNTFGALPNEKMEIDLPNEVIYFIEFRPHKTEISYYNTKTKEMKKGLLKRKK